MPIPTKKWLDKVDAFVHKLVVHYGDLRWENGNPVLECWGTPTYRFAPTKKPETTDTLLIGDGLIRIVGNFVVIEDGTTEFQLTISGAQTFFIYMRYDASKPPDQPSIDYIFTNDLLHTIPYDEKYRYRYIAKVQTNVDSEISSITPVRHDDVYFDRI